MDMLKAKSTIAHFLKIKTEEIDKTTIYRIEKELDKLSISYARLSKQGMNFSKNVILIDELGLLAHIYSMGTHAYVGGGFKRGVHSVLEPAVYSCLIACGPNIEMLYEAKLLKDAKHLSIINNTIDLTVFANRSGVGPNLINNLPVIATDMINVLILSPKENFNMPMDIQ